MTTNLRCVSVSILLGGAPWVSIHVVMFAKKSAPMRPPAPAPSPLVVPLEFPFSPAPPFAAAFPFLSAMHLVLRPSEK